MVIAWCGELKPIGSLLVLCNTGSVIFLQGIEKLTVILMGLKSDVL
jgi:hypothetical protein